jgi:hypothetical protein
MKRVFIEELFNVFNTQSKDYFLGLENVEDHELIAFSIGIMYILKVLKIDSEKITVYDHNLAEELKYIIKEKFYTCELNISDEEKLNDFIHDKDDVNIRKYISSGEG